MTNPFLKAKVDAAIKEIQVDIDKVKLCLKKPQKPRSFLLAEFYHHQKDGRTTLKNGPRHNIDRTNTNRDRQYYTSKHSSHELRATLDPYPRSQQRTDSPHSVTYDKQITRTSHSTAVCQ
jgi:hypothetical protein